MKRISLPYPLVMRQAAQLFKSEEEQQQFYDALKAGASREQAIIVLQTRQEIAAFPKLRGPKWQPEFVTRIVDWFKLSQHDLYAKGAFYSLDLSSCFAASALLAIEPRDWPKTVLDVCAAPGGKSIFAWRALHPDVLICNEVMSKRAASLIENLDRCKIEGSCVVSLDPSALSQRAPEAFDLVIVDAPCSGQSLPAKNEAADGAYNPRLISECVNRQHRIAGHAARCVAPGGYLLYMTCTFAREENEKVAHWIMREYPDFETVPVPALEEFRSPFSEGYAYRLYPHLGFGAGAFTCLLRRKGERTDRELPNLRTTWSFGEPVQREEPAPAPSPKADEKPKPKPRPRPKPQNKPRGPKKKLGRRGRSG